MHHRLALAIALATAPLTAQLGPMAEPVENPTTPEKAMLGKFLFWEEQLSSDDSMACGTCHLPEFGGSEGRVQPAIEPGADGVYGTADDIHGSHGVVRQSPTGDFTPNARFGLERQVTGRWSPSNLGAGHHSALFWDLRASSTFVDPESGATLIPFGGGLESQSLGPIMSVREMARQGRTWLEVRQKLQYAEPLKLARNLTPDLVSAKQQNPTYPALFQAAFGDPAITAARIGFALAAYQRTLNPDQTAWDQFIAGNPSAMTATEQQGWQLFQGPALCSACHWDPLFSDDLVHNLGLRPNLEDVGAMATTGLQFDLATFKTPSLRNAGLRQRMFHNGQSPALDDPAQLTDPRSTLNIYLNGGGEDLSNLDPFMVPLTSMGLTATDMQVIQSFVSTALTDPRVAAALPPFDHPDLRSVAVAPPRQFNTGSTGAVEPAFVDSAPAYPGNLDFRLGLTGGDGPGLALWTYGFSSYEPGLSFGGLPWHLDVFGYVPVALQGTAGSPGYATLHLPIPPDPTLNMLSIYSQLFVDDPLATSSLGIASSKGWEFTFQ